MTRTEAQHIVVTARENFKISYQDRLETEVRRTTPQYMRLGGKELRRIDEGGISNLK